MLPLVILAVAGGVTYGLIKLRPKPKSEVRPPGVVAVEILPVEKGTLTFSVKTQGTVAPRTETSLILQIQGEIVAISPSLYAGGFFRQGDVLLEIDSLDYQTALIRAEADVAQARLNLAQEGALAEQARKDWMAMGDGKPSALVLREPHLQDAQARLRSAEAGLEKAKRDLDRTRIRAPYAGMVRAKHVDLGQYVSVGTRLADIFAIDYAEIRLPLTKENLAYLDLSSAYRGGRQTGGGLKVILRSDFAGSEHMWMGRIVRTEGVVDTRSRVLYAVAQVDDPYALGADASLPPLQMGSFVEAEIEGETVEDVIVLPRHVIFDGDQVLIVDRENILRKRTVEVLRTAGREVVVREGLKDGDQVCLTALEFMVDGMVVAPRLVEEQKSGMALSEVRRADEI